MTTQKWQMLFRANMVMLPIFMSALLSWGAWVTLELVHLQAFRNSGPRYTADQARADRLEMQHDILQVIRNETPPKWLIDRLSTMELQLREIEAAVARMKNGGAK